MWLDEEGRVLASNDQLRWELGYRNKLEFTQKTIFQITPYLTFLEWRKIWQQLQQHRHTSFHAECITQQGAIYPIQVRAKLLDLPDGKVCFCLVENLLTSRAYQELLEITSTITRVGSWQWNLIQNRLLLRKEVHALLELSEDFQPTIRNLLQLLQTIADTGEYDLLKEKIRHSIHTGEQLDVELAVTLPISHQQCQFRLVGVPTFRDGRTVNFYGAIQDISTISGRTDQMYLMEYSVSHAFEMIYWVDPSGKMTYANAKTCETLGYTRQELENLGNYMAIIADYDPQNWVPWEEFKSLRVWQGELTLLAKNGTRIPAYTIANYINYRGRELACIFTRDLREEKNRERLLQISNYTLSKSNELVFWVRMDGSFINLNPVFCQKTNYTEAELRQKNLTDLFPEIAANFLGKRWNPASTGKERRGEAILHDKNGYTLPVRFKMTLTELEGETCICGILTDLSEQKKLEAALQQRGQLVQMNTDSFADASERVCWIRPDGNLRHANAAFLQQFGYTLQELPTLQVENFIDNYNRENNDQLWNKLLRSGVRIGEVKLRLQSGEVLPFTFQISAVLFEAEIAACAILQRVATAQTPADTRSEYERIREWTQLMPNRLTDMLYWTDTQGIVLYANELYCQTIGYPPEEVIGEPLLKFYPNMTEEQAAMSFAMIRQAGNTTGEAVLTTRTDDKIPVEQSSSFVQLNGKEYFSIVLRDLTEQKRREEEQKIEEALAQVNRQKEELESQNLLLREDIRVENNFNNIISTSSAYKKVLKQIERVANSEATVLILGETGTGKELLARALHQLSRRSSKAMIKVNCGAIPESLIESELFGHEKGAFTGAYQQRKGRFELAHEGTIFLDEIGELPLDLQPKLLRVLQEGEFERLGGTKTIQVNVRVIAATNRNLEQQVKEGRFRQDLFYRLNVFPIFNIPLRERKDDIPALVTYFADKFSKKTGKTITNIPQRVVTKLQDYHFPGNVRELENIIERAVVLSEDGTLDVDAAFSLHSVPTGADPAPEPAFSEFKSLEAMQRAYILAALRHTGGRISGAGGAAELLDINDKTLFSRIKKLNIQKQEYL
jgi:PAS domain S-box-containing protein